MNSRKQAYGLHNNFTHSNRSREKNSHPETSQTELDLSEAIEDFTLMAKTEGRAKKTLNLYEYVFGRFTEQVSNNKPIEKITTKDIRKYLASLMDEGLKNTTVAIHHRVLKTFFNWLVEEFYLDQAPTDKIDKPKTPKKFPKVLKKDQVKQLLSAAEKRKREWSGYRNYAMIVCLLDMGLRLNELLSAKIEDLDLKRRSLKVHGKGAKDRKVFFGKHTFRTLRHWMRIRDQVEVVWDETVFISKNGDKLKKRNVQRRITRVQKKAGLTEIQVSPHVLRHTAATFAVENGLDAFSLKRQFGWEEIETALRYVHLSDRQLQETYRNSSPMDNLNH